MSGYDEYQTFMRYKYGYHAFGILAVLLAINYFINYQWAYSAKEEALILMWTAMIYFTVRTVFSGAYYLKNENPLFTSILMTVAGLLYLSDYLTVYYVLFDGNRLGENAYRFMAALFWLSIPIAHGARALTNKIRDQRESKTNS